MKNAAIKLLSDLNVRSYTDRHLQTIMDFMENKSTNIESLLDQLGGWDDTDLAIAKHWLENTAI